MASQAHGSGTRPELALAIYAEALVAQSVVAVLGDSSTGMGELLLALGARAAYVLDPDASRVSVQAATAPRGVTVRALALDEIGARRAARDFDLVMVPDLGMFVDPAALLADVRRMVGEEGVVLVGAANAEASSFSALAVQSGGSRAFDYYELFDLVAQEFDSVRMIAQLPFSGVTLAELSDEEEAAAALGGVSVDTQLGDDATPTFFFALASQRDVRLDPYTIVQLPVSPGQDAVEAARMSEHEATVMRELQARAARADAAAGLEAALQERSRQLAVVSARLDEAQAEIQALKLQGAEELDELIGRVDRAEKRAASALAVQAELEQELTLVDAHPADHERLEVVLKERARVVRELEEELARRDRLVRDLAGALEEAHESSLGGTPPASAGPAEGALKERLDALALDLARRESSARAADWTIAELERRLAIAEQGATPPSGEGDVGARLSAALDEVDALRQALVQEHEARRKAESGAVDPASREGAEGAEGAGGRGAGAGRHEHEERRQGT
jgi:hypothetical protein